MLASGSVQEAHGPRADRAGRHAAKRASRSCTSSTASAPRTRSPRSSCSPTTTCARMIDEELVRAHRARALSPDRPFIRGTAQNPDVFFQARETVNPFYARAARRSCRTRWTSFAERTGRHYHLFDYVGAPDAERVIVLMGSGAETAQETVDCLIDRGEKVGVLKVRLYRPFSARALRRRAARRRCSAIAVLDRTKEPGALGEPLYLDVRHRARRGARRRRARRPCRGSSAAATACPPRNSPRPWSKASSTSWPASGPKRHFTVGIDDDVTHTSLDYDPTLDIEPADDRARGVLRPRRRRHGRRQQELDQDHRRGDGLTRRATSSTTRRSPAR